LNVISTCIIIQSSHNYYNRPHLYANGPQLTTKTATITIGISEIESIKDKG
jgi:hypothetical protein